MTYLYIALLLSKIRPWTSLGSGELPDDAQSGLPGRGVVPRQVGGGEPVEVVDCDCAVGLELQLAVLGEVGAVLQDFVA